MNENGHLHFGSTHLDLEYFHLYLSINIDFRVDDG